MRSTVFNHRVFVAITLFAYFALMGEVLTVCAQEIPIWKAKWEKTVAAAEKEGQINVYANLGPHLVVHEFQKAYPHIKPVVVAGRSSQIMQRIHAERRAGRYLVDVQIGGGARVLAEFYAGKMTDPIKPLLMLPEVVDESKWWQGKHHYLDPDGEYVFVFIGEPQLGSVYYNTKLVNPKEFKSFWDFLNPKWKGKIEARDMRSPGPGGGAMRFYYHNPLLGPKFISRLFGEMDITITRNERQMTDWLAIGKYSLCFFCREVTKAKQQGLPVEEFGLMKEGAGITSKGGTLSLLDRAPHPSAARVFTNWLLSRQGQIAYQKTLKAAEGRTPDSFRIDIPKDDIQPESRRRDGVNYVNVDTPQTRDMRPIFKLLREAIAKAGKNK